MYRSLRINLYLRPFSIAIYEKFDLYCLYLFRLLPGVQIMPLISDNLRFTESVDFGGFQ